MHLVFVIVTILGQLCASAFSFNQTCQQLAQKVRIDDPAIVELVQNTCQNSSNISSTDRAQNACTISYHVFQSGRPGVDDLTEYIRPGSLLYDNPTTINWFDRKIQAPSMTLRTYLLHSIGPTIAGKKLHALCLQKVPKTWRGSWKSLSSRNRLAPSAVEVMTSTSIMPVLTPPVFLSIWLISTRPN